MDAIAIPLFAILEAGVMAVALVVALSVLAGAAMGLVAWGLSSRRGRTVIGAKEGRGVTEYASGMADSTGDPVVGATLAGYRIERRLGRGGMSVVYLAEDLALGRNVALKVLAPELSDDAGFQSASGSSRGSASIDHPNVIPIYEAGEAEGQLYIAMRYVEGDDLRRLIDEDGALDPARAVELVARAADGLEAAHDRGLVHRDVKPSNVLIASPGEHEHVYLADFGLTKTAESEEEAKEVAQLSGTTNYVAPELITGGPWGRVRTCTPSGACCTKP